ncbi:MAG: hypothetical protein GY809_25165, partial [Planctomycetes bacterium]|nr:hypothetical protein [Planctomycetota bacterium]
HIDNYASLAEMVRRRYKYALRGDEIWPDLILIDGGLGQLHAAEKAMIDLLAGAVSDSKTSAFPQRTTLISLAKKEELIYTQGSKDPIRLPSHSPARKLLQYIRDESHRFAQHYHHLLRSKDMME